MKKILINGITLEGANLVPLLLKIRTWQTFDCEITVFGNSLLKEQIDSLNIIREYKFIEFKDTNEVSNKFIFICECLRRNLYCLFYLNKIKNRYDVIYSISSVLDIILFPYFLKKIDKKIKWVTVFDNIVPFTDPGNKFIRFLAWSFFQISLIVLKKADIIYAISHDLKYFLLKRGFNYDQIVITGNAVEIDMIKRAMKNDKYNIDALFIGRINETKGIYDMLKVLKIVKEKYPDFRLAIMGKGDEVTETQFKKKITDMELENNIHFLGYTPRSEKFNIIKSSRCFWFLSKTESESFGIALLEAVCCGLPAFAYDLQPYKHIYRNNEVMIFNKNDYKSVAEKVIEIFDEKKFTNENGKLLLGKFSWDQIAEIEYNTFKNL